VAGEQGVGVATVGAGAGQHLRGEVEAEDPTGRADRGPQVGQGPAGAAARVQGGLPGVQADLGDGGA
jgi:hypothetical protein